MFLFELYKAVRKKEFAMIFLVGIVIVILMATQNNKIIPSKVRINVYKNYIKQIEGEYTQEKHDWLLSERERFEEAIDHKDEYEEKYHNREIEPDVYRELLDTVREAEAKKDTLDYLIQKSEYLGVLHQVSDKSSYFYDLDINDYVENMGIDLMVILLVTVCVVHIFSEDFSCGTYFMVRSSRDGRRRLYGARLLCTLLLSALIGTVFPVIELITKCKTYDMGNLGADIRCLSAMRESSLKMTIEHYLLLCIGTRIAATVFLAVIVMGITQLVKNIISDYVIAVGLVYLPYIMMEELHKFGKVFSLYRGLAVYQGYRSPVHVFGLHGMCLWLAFYSIVCIGIITVIYKFL